ncbi:glycoside hydrolase 100 family protein [Kaarinaea lacus]
MPIENAFKLLNQSIIYFRGEPIGTAAACDPDPVAVNYHECFIRDFVPSALAFLMDGNTQIVKNFLTTVMQVRYQQHVMKGHQRSLGLMPASFKVIISGKQEQIVADFGDRAIGRVTPVDSSMWWMFLLKAYATTTDDWQFVQSDDVQICIKEILDLYLRERFESSPTFIVPDAAFMIDRRMGVFGYPLELQALYYGLLRSASLLLTNNKDNQSTLENLQVLGDALRDYMRAYYWVDRKRLNEMHRYQGEEFGLEVVNVLNVYPESIPDWMYEWLDRRSGYFVGNLGPGLIDFRFFSLGNLLSILFGLATAEFRHAIMNLFESRWDKLIGEMPLKIVYPAVTGKEWNIVTGSDPKNVPWSYHNGGNWPVLIWPFVAAALKAGRLEAAERAIMLSSDRLKQDNWPEYYDGEHGGLIGRRANFYQTWSATGLIVAHQIFENPQSRQLFDRITEDLPA